MTPPLDGVRLHCNEVPNFSTQVDLMDCSPKANGGAKSNTGVFLNRSALFATLEGAGFLFVRLFRQRYCVPDRHFQKLRIDFVVASGVGGTVRQTVWFEYGEITQPGPIGGL